MKIKKVLWIILGIFFIPIVIYYMGLVYIELYSNSLILSDISILILMFELLLACVTAYYENGHFPVRYLLIFIISALIFHLALNKSIMSWELLLIFAISIIFLILAYLLVKILNKKYTLSE